MCSFISGANITMVVLSGNVYISLYCAKPGFGVCTLQFVEVSEMCVNHGSGVHVSAFLVEGSICNSLPW